MYACAPGLITDGRRPPGYEVWGTSTDSLATMLKYQTLIFGSLDYYYLVGTTIKRISTTWRTFDRSCVRGGKSSVRDTKPYMCDGVGSDYKRLLRFLLSLGWFNLNYRIS